MARVIDVIFDGPPSHEAGRFVDVHDENGNGIRVGEWIEQDDGFWALRLEILTEPCAHEFMTDVGRVACGLPIGHHGDHMSAYSTMFKARQGESHDY